MQTIILGAGCFWGVEQRLSETKGVQSTEVGYAGGYVENPTYKEVCTDTTGHAEVVKVTFDESIVSLNELLDVFWTSHNPTTKNRQGPDVGSQYRSVIFYMNDEQKNIALQSRDAYQVKVNKEIVTEIMSFKNYYPAETYHQKYFQKHPNHFCGI